MDQYILSTSIHEWFIAFIESYKTTEEWYPVNGRALVLLDPADQAYKVNEV